MRSQTCDREAAESASARKEGYLASAVKFSTALLRKLQTWLWPPCEEAPSSGRVTPSSLLGDREERRKLVAVKQANNFSLVTRVYRCALYALTDTLDDIGVTVALLEHAKGTLHVSGDKSIDCSPVKERSDTSPPMKRRGMDDSEDEEDDLNVQEQLDRTYDSEDDEDYQPPSDEGVSTDSDEYKDGETESEESGLEQVEQSVLPPRRGGKPPAGVRKKSPVDCVKGASATGSTVKSTGETAGEALEKAEHSAEGTATVQAGGDPAGGSSDPSAVEVLSGQVTDAGPISKTDQGPAGQSTGQPPEPSASPTGVASDDALTELPADPLPQKMIDGQDGGDPGHVPIIDQAKTKIPPSARTP